MKVFVGKYDDTIIAPPDGLSVEGYLLLYLDNFALMTEGLEYEPGIYQNPNLLGHTQGSTHVVGHFLPHLEEEPRGIVGRVDIGPLRVILYNLMSWTFSSRVGAELIKEVGESELVSVLGSLAVCYDASEMSSWALEDTLPMTFGTKYRHSWSPSTFGRLIPESDRDEPRFGPYTGFTYMDVDLTIPNE